MSTEKKKAFDYSKWDKIELSDDESDVHPNIDKDSWFRLKHRTRLEREAKEDVEVAQLEKQNAEEQLRINSINAKLNSNASGLVNEDSEFDDIDALKEEAKELILNISKRNKRIAEIKEKRLWNIDNICKVKEEKTVVNSPVIASLKAEDFAPTGETEAAIARQKDKVSTEKPSASSNVTKVANNNNNNVSSSVVLEKEKEKSPTLPSSPKTREKFAMMSYNDYVLQHEQLLEDFSVITFMDDTKKFLFQHCDVLLHEHAQSYMLLSSLEDEMNGKKDRMKLVCRQSQILSHISELGLQMHRDPRDVILPFFNRMEEKQYLDGFMSAVEDFRKRIVDRAKVKRKEMDEEARKKNPQDVPLGPGGLDPFEVLESLPESLRLAFESQEIANLHKAIAALSPEDAQYHMKRCVDSGLWVPQKSAQEQGDEEGDEVEEIA